MIFSNTFDTNGKFHWQVLCRIRKVLCRNRKVCKCTWKELHRWYFTVNYRRTLLLEKMLWYDKIMGSFKTCVTQERREGRLTKKSNKKWRRERVRSQKMWCHSLKKPRDFWGDVLFKWPLWWCFTLLFFLWVYLLMMLLAFYKTNKPYISK